MATYRAILDDQGAMHAYVKESISGLALDFSYTNVEIDRLLQSLEILISSPKCDYILVKLLLDISKDGYVLTVTLKNGTTSSYAYLR